jgi:hypothetical protein
MWFMSSGQHVQPAITIAQRISVGTPVLGFSEILISIAGFQPSTVHNLVQETKKEIIKDDPNVHFVRMGWYKDILWRYYTAEGRVEHDRGLM